MGRQRNDQRHVDRFLQQLAPRSGNNQISAGRKEQGELRMGHIYFALICQMQTEWPKGRSSKGGTKLVSGHRHASSIR